MANHLRKTIRTAVSAALASLPTTGTRVYETRLRTLQDNELPALRVYMRAGTARLSSKATDPILERMDELIVEGCAKAPSDGTLDDQLDAINIEVEQAIAGNQGAGGAKMIQISSIENDLDGEAERERGVIRMTFQVLYYATRGRPDVAL